ncbi:hypothetical protein [Nocardia carnea]|uniref:hypothetical protein n=1 Tax=Nocardia carnea TaxID=37328 RepID=UPI0024568FAB|nr:hypothetical protein [Nocardia carnea]
MTDDLAARFQEWANLVPYPFDIVEYVERVAEYRGRRIVLCPIDVGALAGTGCGTGSGLWIQQTDHDVIMYGAETRDHAYHIIGHEIGHMLHDHAPGAGEPAGVPDDLPLLEFMPELSLDSIRSVLRRQDYDNEKEREAETFADMLLVYATLPRRKPSKFRSTFFPRRHR